MIVLDTNVISEVFRPEPEGRVVAWMEGLTGDVAMTAVTLAELLAGVRRLPEGRRRSALAEDRRGAGTLPGDPGDPAVRSLGRLIRRP